MHVGIRELRENLRAVLERVKAGDAVVITERGRPVARLVPLPANDPLERLIAEGRVRRPLAPKEPVDVTGLPRMRGDKTLTDYVIEGRG
ncbi:MAG: type II toxin-antitoxin system Phd/YefM family antitoxin [Gaiellaceae bacterium]